MQLRFKIIDMILIIIGLSVTWIIASDLQKVEKLARECEAGKEKSCRALFKIAQTDKDWKVRLAAVSRMSDSTMLSMIAKTDADEDLRKTAAANPHLTDSVVLAEIAQKDAIGPVRRAAVNNANLNNPSLLTDLAMTSKDPSVCKAAVAKLSEPVLLAKIARAAYLWDSRLLAVEKLNDPEVLAEVARNDEYHTVREAAVAKLLDPMVLTEIIQVEKDQAVRRRALTMLIARVPTITDPVLLAFIAQAVDEPEIHRVAVENPNLVDQVILADLARTAKDWYVRSLVVEKLNDQAVLTAVARSDPSVYVRCNAVVKILDPMVLDSIAKEDVNARVRRAAVEKLTDQTALVQIAENDKDQSVREAAVNKISDPLVLVRFAERTQYIDLSLGAVRQLQDTILLAEIAQSPLADQTVRIAAMDKMNNDHAVILKYSKYLDYITTGTIPFYCRLRLLANEPCIQSKFPRLKIQCAISPLEREYGLGWKSPIVKTIRGESVQMVIWHDDLELARAEWKTKFPDSIEMNMMNRRRVGDNREYIPANVSGIQLLEQFFNNKVFTSIDLKELIRSNIPDVRLAVVANPKFTDRELLVNLARQDKNSDVREAAKMRLLSFP